MDVAPLFKPFRALGYITDNVPFAVNRRGKETFVTVSVGKAWQIYNYTKLTLSLVGPQLHGDVRALACKDDLTFAAVGGDVVESKRLHRTGLYHGGHSGPVRQLLVLGDLLLSLGQSGGPAAGQGTSGSGGRLVVWSIGQYDRPQLTVEFESGFLPTVLCHPDTYLNKVLVGSERGQLQLVNIRTGSVIHTFGGWGSAVRALAPSPALDVMGVGLADGRVVLHNIRCDQEVATFSNAAGSGLAADSLLGGGAGRARGDGAVTALSFRTGAGLPLMAAGGGGGAVTVWDLEERRLHTVIKEAHDAQLLSLHFFVGEPLLMSSAADNSVKHWVFDSADAMPRMLRFRAGHAAPPTVVRHYGEGGARLLSAGCDRAFRVFSVHQDQQSRELSQGHTAKRAKRLKVAEQELKLERVVDMDADRVTGLHVSSDCRWLLSSSMDGTMRVWDIPAAQCLQVMKLGSPVTSLSLSPSLDLLATSHVNRRGIYLWSNQAVFGPPAAIPHSEAPVPLVRAMLPTISDGRHRVGAADGEDGEDPVALWCEAGAGDDEDEDGYGSEDEAAEAERRRSAAASGAQASSSAPTGPQPYDQRDTVSGAPLPLAPQLVTLSLLPRSQWSSLAHIEVIKARNKPMQPAKKPEAAPFFLPTVPGLDPNPVFDTSAPSTAGGGEEGEEARADGGPDSGEAGAGPGSTAAAASGSRIVRFQGGKGGVDPTGAAAPVSPFVRLLRKAAAAAATPGGDATGAGEEGLACWGPVLALLRGMSPVAVDRELRSMSVLEGGHSEAAEVADLGALLDMLCASLGARRDFEFCQALLSVVLAQHGDTIVARPQLADRAARLRDVVASGWRRVDTLLQHVRCVVGFLGNLQS
ncbi:WD repeat domain-containing protein [Tetrabaena socialis]|uniref:WD repeat domain-containing protein n=1 Tax=Tetrabaena socialis TaxID=47790 RepID=A0A2J8ACB8_9CHLO|nr:WD repeat domain-containing protein [Tetrabaena socialis]|eukprot:PNH10160.1 WD repeat domain-containing protein [Tetrabaena socialis]